MKRSTVLSFPPSVSIPCIYTGTYMGVTTVSLMIFKKTYGECHYALAYMLATAIHCHPSLVFAGKAGACLPEWNLLQNSTLAL